MTPSRREPAELYTVEELAFWREVRRQIMEPMEIAKECIDRIGENAKVKDD